MPQKITLIENLNAVAKCHKEHCHDENCGISLWMIKVTAMELAKDIRNTDDLLKITQMEWPS